MRCVRLLAVAVLLAAATGCSLLRSGPDTSGYELEIVGNESLSRADLLAAAVDDLDDFAVDFRKSAIDDAAYAMERAYKTAGFAFAQVEYEYAPGPPPSARFLVEEGPRTEITAIAIDGNEAFGDEELASFFPRKRTGLLGVDRAWYARNAVDSALGGLAALYASRGWLDVEVELADERFSEDRTGVELDVVVREGVRYVLRDVRFEGELALEPERLEAVAAKRVGKPFTQRIPFEMRAALLEIYQNEGYADVTIDVEQERGEDGAVVVTFAVAPGRIVTVSAVLVEGEQKTREGFIRRRVLLEHDQPYSRALARESSRRLYRTGLFKQADVELKEGPGTERPLVVRVEELPSLELWAEPGWGSYERARISLGVRDKDLFGYGRILSAEGTLSNFHLGGDVSLTDPSFLQTEVSAELSVFGSRREEPSFTRLEVGTGLAFTRRFTQVFRALLGYQYRRSDVADVRPDAPELDEDVNISSISFAPTWDWRDNLLAPRGGGYTRLRLEWAADVIGSQLDFVRGSVDQSLFVELAEGTVLGLNARAGAIVPIGSTSDIPIQERYFNGGENSVRSFKEDELGPKDVDGDPTGGEAWSMASIELRQAIKGSFEAAAFYDVGNVTENAEDFWEFADYRSGIGVGLRYMLPIGPLRLDWAANPSPREDEDDWVVHFSVGMSF